MRRLHILLVLGVVAMFVAAGYLILLGFGMVGRPGLAAVKQVPAGHQEIAWIAPATSGEAWERLVAAVDLLRKEWSTVHPSLPGLQVSLDKAFLQLTADVPEISLRFEGVPGAGLLVRWYKLSSELGIGQWMKDLARRSPPPVAILGGETSDRALAMAQALRDFKGRWRGADPLFLITTATADNYVPAHQRNVDLTEGDWPKLMEVYKGQTFRFAFNNTRMADAVMEFLRQYPEVWPPATPVARSLATVLAMGPPWNVIGGLAAIHQENYFLYSLAWFDDRYSQDLSDRFAKVFIEMFPRPIEAGLTNVVNGFIHYSVGDYYHANPREELAVDLFLADHSRLRDQHVLLALPTGSQRARRFLRTLCRRAPAEIRDLLAITGDSVTFNHIFRDRDVAWNIQDLPVALVFFSHRNPIDVKAGFGQEHRDQCKISTTGTQDLLFYRDIVEAMLQAAFERDKLLDDAGQVRERLAQSRWYQNRVHNPLLNGSAARGLSLFDAEGNRTTGTGEHVVWLKPAFHGDRILPRATISVFYADREDGASIWQRFGAPLEILYGRSRAEEIKVHARD